MLVANPKIGRSPQRGASAVLTATPAGPDIPVLAENRLQSIALSESEHSALTLLNKDIDRRVSALRPYLFRMADTLLDLHAKNPITGIVVDDCSARFMGCFIHMALRSHAEMPVEFYKVSEELKHGSSATPEALEVSGAFRKLGSHPVFITDIINEGSTAIAVCRLLKKAGASPVVASIVNESLLQPRRTLRRHGGAEQIIFADNYHNLSLKINYSKALNGVVSHQGRVIPWWEAEDGMKFSTLVRRLAVQHSREKLCDLFEAYNDPARQRAGIGWHLREFYTAATWRASYGRDPFEDPARNSWED